MELNHQRSCCEILDARSGKSNHGTFAPDSVTERVCDGKKKLTNNLSASTGKPPLHRLVISPHRERLTLFQSLRLKTTGKPQNGRTEHLLAYVCGKIEESN